MQNSVVEWRPSMGKCVASGSGSLANSRLAQIHSRATQRSKDE